jgi:hypothetical protein
MPEGLPFGSLRKQTRYRNAEAARVPRSSRRGTCQKYRQQLQEEMPSGFLLGPPTHSSDVRIDVIVCFSRAPDRGFRWSETTTCSSARSTIRRCGAVLCTVTLVGTFKNSTQSNAWGTLEGFVGDVTSATSATVQVVIPSMPTSN